MHIEEVTIRNFRILSETKMNINDKLCLMIGRNNTGKTSFMILFEKFLNGNEKFDFNDFSLKQRKKILNFNKDTDEVELAIQLILNIQYEDTDDLCNISEFIVDLDPVKKDVYILFECIISKDKLLEAIQNATQMTQEKFIKKYLSEYLDIRVFTFNNIEDLKKENRDRLIKKDMKDVKKLIDFEIIHAKRKVSSSEEKNGLKVLSGLTTSFFNELNIASPDKFEGINKLIENMDSQLDKNYDMFFDTFLKTARDFLGMDQLKVVSNLKASEILTDASEVVYGSDDTRLPEYLNGLGHMNVLYLLLSIEIKKNKFKANKKDIKILFIEEPEAHTHPQLQYIFARKISDIVNDISGMQTIITTHSPHIVANHPFENIRYMSVEKDSQNFCNIQIKNFHNELSTKYESEIEEFQFVKQYLSTESAELFFADKAIFIEGISEGMLMQYFISQFDCSKLAEETKNKEKDPQFKASYVPLAAQNVAIVQAGANAKAFRHFLEFLKIPSLIITDIDTIKPKQTSKGKRYEAAAVKDIEVCGTSNETIKYYLAAPKRKDEKDVEYTKWLANMLHHRLNSISSNIQIAYQKEENGYQARSFEDAFINVNIEQIKTQLQAIKGLVCTDEFETNPDIYNLTNKVIDKKSDFASSLLFLAHVKEIKWNVPSYIWEGIEWLQKQQTQ